MAANHPAPARSAEQRLEEPFALSHAYIQIDSSGNNVNKILAILLGGFLLFSVTAQAAENEAGLDYWNSINKETMTTDSGLQYKVRHMGNGRKPSAKSKVSVHYRGLLLNGAVFDSSYSEEEPISFSLRSVVKGWREGIPLMPVGSVFIFLIPPDLAYGEKRSGLIPPNSTLIFEVELYAVK